MSPKRFVKNVEKMIRASEQETGINFRAQGAKGTVMKVGNKSVTEPSIEKTKVPKSKKKSERDQLHEET